MKRKPKLKKRKIIISRIIMLFLILFGLILVGYQGYRSLTKKKISNFSNITEEKIDNKSNKISLIMVGDALIHSSVYNDAYVASSNSYDFTKQVELIKPIVSTYDLAFYNQETILGGVELGLSNYPRFNSPYEVGDAMIDAGFNLVNLATNHTLDKNATGVKNSCNYWKDKNVYHVGSYCSYEEQSNIPIGEKNGITYALLGYTTSTNGIPMPSDGSYYVNVYSKDFVKRQVEEIRDKVDLLMVSMHWGTEYTHYPTSGQKEIANFLASLGVDIVIGHHPHVVEPVTYIDDTLVIYSLGNFISSQYQDEFYNKMVGLMTSVDIIKDKDTGEIELENVNNELLYTYYKNWKGFKVVPFSQMNSTYLSNYKEVYQKYASVVKMYDEAMPVVALN